MRRSLMLLPAALLLLALAAAVSAQSRPPIQVFGAGDGRTYATIPADTAAIASDLPYVRERPDLLRFEHAPTWITTDGPSGPARWDAGSVTLLTATPIAIKPTPPPITETPIAIKPTPPPALDPVRYLPVVARNATFP